MSPRAWTGAVATACHGRHTAFGARLTTPAGHTAWQTAERTGNRPESEALQLALQALSLAARRHRARPATVLEGDPALLTAARALLPTPPEFLADRLEPVGPGHLIAHGTRDYQVWPELGICSCPAFTYGTMRPCKHLNAARDPAKRYTCSVSSAQTALIGPERLLADARSTRSASRYRQNPQPATSAQGSAPVTSPMSTSARKQVQ